MAGGAYGSPGKGWGCWWDYSVGRQSAGGLFLHGGADGEENASLYQRVAMRARQSFEGGMLASFYPFHVLTPSGVASCFLERM